MYAAHFGLTERPFSLAPDPRYLFLSDGHREALAHLVYGLQGGGFVQLTGGVGTGKTTVCRALLDQLPAAVDVAMIFTPRLTAVELLSAICDELSISYPPGTTSLKVLVDVLAGALLDAHARGRRTVVIIDEAQNLSMEVLEELRLLTNIETTRDKLLQVILIGQPELVDLMERPALRQLAQRITARYQLRPFTFSETRAYIQHRLRVAGQRQLIFAPGALRVVHRRSGGVPRLINNICDRALLGAFGRSKRQVAAAMARTAAAEVSGSRGLRRWLQPAAAVLLVAAVLFTAGMLGRNRLGYVAGWWGQRLVPSAVPPSNAAVVTPPPAPAAAPSAAAPSRQSLATLLDATTADRNVALATLFDRWGVDFAPRPGESACEVAHRAGLRCLIRSAAWNVVRRLDVPVMLTLTTPTGDRHYVTATALADDAVTVEVARKPIMLALTDVDRFWDGAFVALWRSPDLAATDLKPGDDLRRRVVAFQRANGLLADGVLGEETLLRLAATISGPRPSLSRSTP